MEHLGALWWRNGQIRDPSNEEIGAHCWSDGKIEGPIDHELFSNGLMWLHYTLSNLWVPNFNWEILDDMKAEKKKIHEAPIPHFSSHISKIVWWLPMFDFGIFCHLLRVSHGDILGRSPPSGYLKSFISSFLFFSSFSFSFVSFLGPL